MHGRSQLDMLINAYREGVFPMADSADDPSFAFYRPYQRGIIPIESVHIPSKLLKVLRRHDYMVTINQSFEAVIDGCAAAKDKRSTTWINRPIRDLFVALHHEGRAHSIETRRHDGTLIGGLYGLAIGRVFCGESMFSEEPNASKIALIHLCALLWSSGFTTLDTQFINPHLLQFGAYEIPQEEYEERIATEMAEDIPLQRPSGDEFKSLLERFLSERKV
ncbi:MAG: leucyl/phenylalanyl-tRNA--protein transferase [Micavibrio aeruginosavorus]|uniref:Leucyl/phenylalanyl-tRNA--protein transferase n=1 Tax=Micavibrio aeruginosavorus TaxID=349221 RepID=A0A2W5A1A7_9BACT|nr:MAG: leucyl/phenylalanyl-tRNA--protein transferase [Micavibrio aeruginosavorus]